ncbi:Uncharacterized membrane protein YccC [Enhydrobacter aerosaccus]|uniref:Uncharacterized membrane protein YccC n=1 Tax=Enhydrobacter aerosaccus TaxID=225324 RepID=A0A1T4SP48_9HYPH|nr:FUSC family protein [Enhydrobacter aerosaccus]SKA29936.1 Uncharacterized membrane protein YccC [Enhydrobacter aerosaccus]
MDNKASGLSRPDVARPGASRWLPAIWALTRKILFGLRLWIAVCLALYVAFRLELDNAYWAGASAAIVCQPSVGASLRRGAARLVGTVVGAAAVVALTACFAQDRAAFLLGMAIWAGACAFTANLLRDSASYGAALAGFTAVIVAGDELGATGGPGGDVFILAVTRASEICIGIVCATVVLAGTDLGDARRRLASELAALAGDISHRFGRSLARAGAEEGDARPARHALATRIVALSPLVDEALGEVSDLRHRVAALRAATDGLVEALSGWRTAANCLKELQEEDRREAEAIFRLYPAALRLPLANSLWTGQSGSLIGICRGAVRALVVLPVRTPSLRLLADGTAQALRGLSQTASGLTALVDPTRAVSYRRRLHWYRPDLLPAAIAAVRVLVTIVALELFWVVTAWPSGAWAMSFAAIGVILFSPREAQAYSEARAFTIGLALAAAVAAIVRFAILPGMESFAGLSLVIGGVLVPVGILSLQPWQTSVFKSFAIFFCMLLAPANLMTFDTVQYYNQGLAVVVGMGSAAIGFLLIPPLSPAARASRILEMTLRDFRRLAAGRQCDCLRDWESRLYRRLADMPAAVDAEPLARFVAMLSMGSTIIRLRLLARRFKMEAEIDTAFSAVAEGKSATAISHLATMERELRQSSKGEADGTAIARACGAIHAALHTLTRYGDYFDGLESVAVLEHRA